MVSSFRKYLYQNKHFAIRRKNDSRQKLQVLVSEKCVNAKMNKFRVSEEGIDVRMNIFQVSEKVIETKMTPFHFRKMC